MMEASYTLDMDHVRKLLVDRLRASGLNMRQLSENCGLNPAYFQQFIKRGVPHKLPEEVRAKAAQFLGLDEHMLRYNVGEQSTESRIPVSSRSDPAQNKAVAQAEQVHELDVRKRNNGTPLKPVPWTFPLDFLHQEIRAPGARILIIEMQGDSMEPTIHPGQRVLVDTSHIQPTPAGIYALRDTHGYIVIKRLQEIDNSRMLRVLYDNPKHEPRDVTVDDISIVGKVIGGWTRY